MSQHLEIEINFLDECAIAIDNDLVYWFAYDCMADEPDLTEEELLDHIERELFPHSADDVQPGIWQMIASHVNQKSRSVI
jgi:hypothetical protein